MSKPRISKGQAKAILICDGGVTNCPNTCPNYGLDQCTIGEVSIDMLAADLLEAYKLIEEQANTLLKIAQEPICSVCQGIKDMAKAQWEKSKEWI